MMYSILLVASTNMNGTVNGNWLQDFSGSLEEAKMCCREIEKANSNRIECCVVNCFNGGSPNMGYIQGKWRLG